MGERAYEGSFWRIYTHFGQELSLKHGSLILQTVGPKLTINYSVSIYIHDMHMCIYIYTYTYTDIYIYIHTTLSSLMSSIKGLRKDGHAAHSSTRGEPVAGESPKNCAVAESRVVEF